MDVTELDLMIVTELRRIMRAVDMNSRDLLHVHGVTTPQLLTLRELVMVTECRVGALASRVRVSQATMTGIVDRLTQHGFTVRKRKEEDRRSVFVRITDKGRQFVESAPSLLQDRFRSELAHLPAGDRTRILASLQQVAKMMGADELTASPILTTGAESLAGPAAIAQPNIAAGRPTLPAVMSAP